MSTAVSGTRRGLAKLPGNAWAQGKVEALLRSAGVRVGGTAPWDIQIHDRRFYRRVLVDGSLGLGESYMDAWWDAENVDALLARLLASGVDRRVRGLGDVALSLRSWLSNAQAGRGRMRVAERHYDLGNDLFEAMLGRRLVYSCGYWAKADNLDEAQAHKLDLIARKLGLQPGMRVLDIGCGWGEALKYMAERHGVDIVGITISREQAEYATRLCHGLPAEVRLQDYRDLTGRFDRVFSVGMFEHVGVRNYRTYFSTIRRCLADDGLALVHTIGSNVSVRRTDPWIERYIFPNSMLPSAAQITRAIEGLFVLEDWHGFGPDYDRTLEAWRQNVERRWPSLPNYDERFRRMWRYYLAGSMAAFRTRRTQLWQLVLSPKGVPGGYASCR